MFEFYYQSGEFVGDSGGFWKDFGLPFLGIGIPLLIYYLGVRKEKEKEDAQKLNYEKQKLDYLLHLVSETLRFSKHLQASLAEIVSNLHNDPSTLTRLKVTSSDDLRRLVMEISREDYYHAYKNRISDDRIVGIFRGADTIERLKVMIIDYWEKISLLEHSRKTFIFNTVKTITLEIGEVDSTLPQDQDIKDGLLALFDKFQLKPKKPKRDYLEFRDEVFVPAEKMLNFCTPQQLVKWLTIKKTFNSLSNTVNEIYLEGSNSRPSFEAFLEKLETINSNLTENSAGLRGKSEA